MNMFNLFTSKNISGGGSGGFVKTVIILVIALLILSYYGFNLRNTIESPNTQSNFGYVKSFIVNVWNNYLKKPATYLWKDVFIKYIWNTAIENLKRLNGGQTSTINERAPLAAPVATTT